MDIIIVVLRGLLLAVFWSAVLSYIPITFYLITKNPLSNKIERARRQGIYILGRDSQVENERRAARRNVAVIFGACFLLCFVWFIINLARGLRTGIYPFNILSALSVVFFWFSVLTYLPAAFYLALHNPRRFKEEGVYLKRIFISYGLAILAFCVIYAKQWLHAEGLAASLSEVAWSFLVVSLSAAFISYLPVLLYMLTRARKPLRINNVRPNVIFVIYSISFILFACIYMINWVSDRRVGIVQIPLEF